MSQPKMPNRGLIIFAMALGMFMASLDNTIVSTAMPTVVSELGRLDIFSWVFSAYLLTSTTFIPIFGKLADLYGKKQFYLFGVAVFVLGSLLSGMAESMNQLIAFRALQGFGAAAMMPITYAMLYESFPKEQRGKMQGIFSAIFGLSSAIGPTIGGYFTDYLSWHWIFYVNIPIGLFAFLIILGLYKNIKVRDTSQKIVIDYLGSFTLTLSILSLMYALASAGRQYEWGSWQIVSLLSAAVVLLIVFLFVEKRAKDPIIPLYLFRKNGVVSSNFTAFLMGAVLLGASSYIPLFIQGVIGGSASKAGDLVTPMMFGLIFGSGACGALMQRMPYRPIQIGASLVMIVGAWMLSQLNVDTSNSYVVYAMIVLGLGLGPLFPIPIAMMQGSVNEDQVSIASSLITFFRNIGMAMGISFLSIIVNTKLSNTTDAAFQNATLPPQQLALLKDPHSIFSEQGRQMIPADIFHKLQVALSDGVDLVFWACLFIAVGCLILGFVAGNHSELSYQKRKAAKQQGSQSM
ncbi:MFS transporter [Tumebacillus sp. ITR2]|uniref:MFS transporter n=1 Tax=Tumebacillus amylolyticus TaxID=2801339 RepID=A0ABS1J744_9BACL|nr:MDR family MFS transporter [Tumebacillus amylolyticus]MBL0386015.1 MFS transporter [Tumebacillus amylolyticus]